uniref:phosphomethylpyrimidine synthase ThiC n=1 Tax=Thermosulfurimonas sp. TaxID=2080236 RepID=UPI0025FCC3EC
MTELEAARQGEITGAMRKAAEEEGVSPEFIREGVARGTIVLIKARQSGRVVAVGEGVRTKVNASIGTSSDLCDLELEKRKARLAEEAGADT